MTASGAQFVGIQPRFPGFLNRWKCLTAPVAAERVAALRIATALALLLDIGFGLLPHFAVYFSADALGGRDLYPSRFREGHYYWSLLRVLPDGWGPTSLFAVWIAAAVGLLVGYRPLVTGLVCWACSVSVWNINPGICNGGDQLRNSLLLLVSFCRSGAVWGMQSVRQTARAGVRSVLAGDGADRSTRVRLLLQRGVQAARTRVAVGVRDVLREPRSRLVVDPESIEPVAGRSSPTHVVGHDRLGTRIPALDRAEGLAGNNTVDRRALPRAVVLHAGGRALRAVLAGVLSRIRAVGAANRTAAAIAPSNSSSCRSNTVRRSSSSLPVLHAPDDGRRARSQSRREFGFADARLSIARCTAVGTATSGSEPPPTYATSSRTSTVRPGNRPQPRRERLGPPPQFRERRGEHPQRRDFAQRAFRVAVEPQRRFERRERHLVEPEGPHQRVLLDLLNERRLARDDARPAGRRAACRR